METEQLSAKLSLGKGRNKEIKGFLKFNEMNAQYTKIHGKQWRQCQVKTHNGNCLHQEFGDICNEWLSSTSESSRTERIKHT